MANDMALKRGKFGLKSFALSRKKIKTMRWNQAEWLDLMEQRWAI